jgi:hypothetical protein
LYRVAGLEALFPNLNNSAVFAGDLEWPRGMAMLNEPMGNPIFLAPDSVWKLAVWNRRR